MNCEPRSARILGDEVTAMIAIWIYPSLVMIAS